jgi:G:T/U-mismatch repair DNA glycosylase
VAVPEEDSFKKKMWKMMKKIFCRQSEIMKTQKKILRRQQFTMDYVAAQTGRPYISEEEESETEEEVSGDSEEEDFEEESF